MFSVPIYLVQSYAYLYTVSGVLLTVIYGIMGSPQKKLSNAIKTIRDLTWPCQQVV